MRQSGQQVREKAVGHRRIDNMWYRSQWQLYSNLIRPIDILLQQILSQHQNLSIWPEALHSSQISYPLLQILLRAHDFEYIEGSPAHVVPEHFEVD